MVRGGERSEERGGKKDGGRSEANRLDGRTICQTSSSSLHRFNPLFRLPPEHALPQKYLLSPLLSLLQKLRLK